MKMTLAATAIGLTVGNYFHAFIAATDYATALERSFFQIVALAAAYVLLAARASTESASHE